ncbi:MAG: ABC transporter ATP-binding protein [Gammaproteobacteria bacterium]|nr:ABC transporter ATP-binding protein [Gammaproteobacteria bacterium]
MKALLQCREISIRAGNRELIHQLQWRIEPQQCWGILGPNGCGKTSLLHSLAGLREVEEGGIFIQQQSINSYSRRELAQLIGLLFQHSSYDFPTRVEELVMSGRFAHQNLLAGVSAEDRQLVHTAMQNFMIAHLAERAANTLSGGEMQRVAMAILHTQSPRIALLDEPENHLDPGVMFKLLQLLKEFFSIENRSCIMVLHDPSVAVRLCSHLLLLFGDGRYIKGRTMEIATPENLSELYAHPMHAVNIDDGLLFYPG